MKLYEMFILSLMEMFCFVVVWNSMDERFKNKSLRKAIGIITVSLISILLNIFEIKNAFIVNYIAIIVLFILFFKISFKDMIFNFFIAFGIIIGIQMVGTYILTLLYKELNYSFINGLIINTISTICCIIIGKFTPLMRIKNILDASYKVFLLVFFNIVFMVIIFQYFWQNNKGYIWSYNSFSLPFIVIWIIMNFYVLYQTIILKQQEQVIYIHERYMPFFTELIEEARRKQHDYANHLNAIYGLTELDDSDICKDKIREYLKGLIKDFKVLDKILAIREPVLSAIIYSKRALAESKNIVFRLDIVNRIPHYPIEDYELVDILGNLLDNAIEAAEKIDVKLEREVLLTLGEEGKKKIIEVKNSGEAIELKNIENIFQKGFSTKKGKHRGYGLYNVKRIVNKNNATIELSFRDKYTIFKVLF